MKSVEMKPGKQFVFAGLAYFLSGKLRAKKKGFESKHLIPSNFFGVGVATSEAPSTDEYVISRLRELGITQVRLDFTYGDEQNHVARFLERLSAESFQVMLHLVQPFHEAGAMETSPAQDRWKQFVSDVLNRFGERVDLVEVGSTVNRRRWAGYTLNGFLSAWEIAHKEIKTRDVELAGPNVTDFEPPFNIGLLSILKSRDLLPDVHTTNLFSERCIEPERYDHKIFGRRLASLCGLTLIKKAQIVQKIGQDFGVPSLVSPVAFWTLPRIQRFLPEGEEKQADYLARYMILCAASGVLQRVSWGPLVGQREGIIDDETGQTPALDRVVHYAGVSGSSSSYRLRPAFHAMKTVSSLLSDMRYEGCLKRTRWMEVHDFSSEKQRLHVLWTRNSKAAVLQDVYANGDLENVESISRDGEVLDNSPDLITESPLYLRFSSPEPVAIRADVDAIKNLSIHRHIKKTHCFFRKDDWQGMLLVQDENERRQFDAILPSKIGPPSSDALLRHARNAVWKVPDPRDPSRNLVIKQPIKMRFYKKWLSHFKPSKGVRSWSGAAELLRRGIETAPPIAFFEQKGAGRMKNNFYICEHVEADFSARHLCSSLAMGQKEVHGVSGESALRQLCVFLFKIHKRGVFFRDLSGGNILIKKTGDDTLSFSLIDTGRAHFFDHATPLPKRISDLTRVCTKMNAESRSQFMEMYMGGMGKTFTLRLRIPFYLYNTKAVVKRFFRKKNLIKRFKR